MKQKFLDIMAAFGHNVDGEKAMDMTLDLDGLLAENGIDNLADLNKGENWEHFQRAIDLVSDEDYGSLKGWALASCYTPVGVIPVITFVFDCGLLSVNFDYQVVSSSKIFIVGGD